LVGQVGDEDLVLDEDDLTLIGSLVGTTVTGAAWTVIEFINGPLLDNPRRVGGTLRARGRAPSPRGHVPLCVPSRRRREGVTVVRVGRRRRMYRTP
jgi:hypothetical protein